MGLILGGWSRDDYDDYRYVKCSECGVLVPDDCVINGVCYRCREED